MKDPQVTHFQQQMEITPKRLLDQINFEQVFKFCAAMAAVILLPAWLIDNDSVSMLFAALSAIAYTTYTLHGVQADNKAIYGPTVEYLLNEARVWSQKAERLGSQLAGLQQKNSTYEASVIQLQVRLEAAERWEKAAKDNLAMLESCRGENQHLKTVLDEKEGLLEAAQASYKKASTLLTKMQASHQEEIALLEQRINKQKAGYIAQLNRKKEARP